MASTPVAIVVPHKAQSLDISGPLDAFLEANRQAPGRCNYDVRLLSASPDRAVTAAGMSLVTHGSIFEDEGPIDTLLVAGTPDYAQAYAESAARVLLRRHALRSRRHGSVCTGAFFLGAAGLLDWLNVTTHWQHAAELAERFPAAKVTSDRIFVQDGSLWTSAGVTAGIDLALKLIEDDHGRDVALSVARRDERAQFYPRISAGSGDDTGGLRRDGACRFGATAARRHRQTVAARRIPLRLCKSRHHAACFPAAARNRAQ